jgi:hypothetical protein
MFLSQHWFVYMKLVGSWLLVRISWIWIMWLSLVHVLVGKLFRLVACFVDVAVFEKCPSISVVNLEKKFQ